MATERGILGKTADRVRRESPLPVYPVHGGIPADDPVYWDGRDVGEFLTFAKRVGAPAIYLEESIVPDDEADPDYAGHVGETSSVQFSFLLDGRFHAFAEVADWVPEKSGPDEAGESTDEGMYIASPPRGGHDRAYREGLAKAGAALVAGKDEIIAGYLEKLRASDRTPPDPDSEWDLRRDLLAYLADQLDLPALKGGPLFFDGSRDSEADKPVAQTASEIARKLRLIEREAVDRSVTGCLEWVSRRDIPLRSLNADRVREYADEISVRLSRSGIRDLRDRVAAEIKRKRVGGSHHG
ncbi:MAG TPA: hypothetical protein VGS23_05175 [Thermoplasmata archaeon]|nr:hypothetical protein [Thermoplasmata archaeon]HZY91375.1 hypothetical protein [Thermoplasmata archaeon]